MKKQSLNIGISSMRCWLYLDGNMNNAPIRAFSDANCDVFIGKFRPTHDGMGEEWSRSKYIEYSTNHIVKLRDGFDGFLDEKHYGEIKTKEGNSPFINENEVSNSM